MKRILYILSEARIKVLFLSAYLLLSFFLSAALTISHFPLLMDFGSFLASGHEALAKGNPYNHENDLVFTVYSVPSPNLNPPISILLFKLVASIKIDPIKVAMVWKIASLLWYIAIVYYLIKTHPESSKLTTILWVFTLAGFWQTVEVGQIYMPLVTVTLLVWDRLKKNKSVAAGMLIGLLIAIKPQFAIWAFFLFFTKQRTTSIISAITSVAISLIPFLVFGTEVYVQWVQAVTEYNGILLPGNTSLQSFFAHLGIPGIGITLSTILLLLIPVHIIIKKTGVMQASALSLVCISLISPYSWCGYTLFLLPVFFDQSTWSWKKQTAAGLLATPFLVILAFFTKATIYFVLFGWAYGWAVVLLLLDELSRSTLHFPEK
jgi:hypothetical protein